MVEGLTSLAPEIVMKNLLAAGLVLVVGSIALSQSPKSDPKSQDKNPDRPRQWEYKAIVLDHETDIRGTAQNIEHLLNNGDEKGWELFRVEQEVIYVLRRMPSEDSAVKPDATAEVVPSQRRISN